MSIILLVFGTVVVVGFISAGLGYIQYLKDGGSLKTITIRKVETTCIQCRRLRIFTRQGPYR